MYEFIVSAGWSLTDQDIKESKTVFADNKSDALGIIKDMYPDADYYYAVKCA